MFDPSTGFYARSGVIKNGKDTGVDPFMTSYPELLDIGIMQTCVCSHKCNVDCYQKAIERTGNNMSVEDFESILKQSKGKLFQVALGALVMLILIRTLKRLFVFAVSTISYPTLLLVAS
jgi:hypothetical protein